MKRNNDVLQKQKHAQKGMVFEKENTILSERDRSVSAIPSDEAQTERKAKQKSRKKAAFLLLAAAILLGAALFLIFGVLHRGVTVTFDCNAPTEETYCEPAPMRLSKGDAVLQPAFPIRKSWKFAGWYLDEGCTAKYEFGAAAGKDLTLYARWIDGNSEEAAITDAEWAEFLEVEKALSDAAAPFRGEDGYVPEEKRSTATEALAQRAKALLRDGRITYVSREINGVYVEFASCLSLNYYFSSPLDASGGYQKITAVSVEPFAKADTVTFNSFGIIENVWGPVATQMAGEITGALLSHSHSHSVYGPERAAFRDLRDAEQSIDIFLWDGHGHYSSKYGPELLTSEIVPDDKAEGDWYWANRFPFGYFDFGKVDNDPNRYITLTPKFIAEYLDLDHALVYLSACDSGHENDNRLADAFIEAGADTVFFNAGADAIKTQYSETMMALILRYMIGSGPILRDGSITNEADGIFHTAAEALKLAEDYMTILCRMDGVTYGKKCFYFDDNNTVHTQDSQPALSENSKNDYTVCSGIKGKIVCSDNSVDPGKITLRLTGPEERLPDIYRDGEFYFNDLPLVSEIAGYVSDSTYAPYRLTIEYDGTPLQEIDNIRVGRHSFTDLKTIDLSGNCLLSVVVTDEEGNSLPNTVIEADNGENVYYPVQTDPDEPYHTMVQKGKYTIRVSVPGYAPQEEKVHLREDMLLSYKLKPIGTVSGTVMRSGDQKAIILTSVKLVSEDGTHSYKTHSGLSGKYRFGELPPGNYVLSCTRKGYENWEMTISLNPDVTTDVQQDIELNRISIGMVILRIVVGVISLIICAFAIFGGLGPTKKGDASTTSLITRALKIFFAGVLILAFYLLITGKL